MLTRRNALLGSGCALATLAARAHAETAPDGFTVVRASTAGFNGTVPGPVIRARRGDEVKVLLVNGLDEPVALYWHGVRLRNAMDGSPLTSRPVAPGASFAYRFAVPDAGTFWYRAVRRDQQQRGLHGALIVEEQASPPVDRDQLLLFADRRDGDGTRHVTINGASAVDIATRPNERLRLRFVNASATQMMNARIDRHRVFVMALDGEPAEPFVGRDGRLSLGPGNRADVFIDATLPSGSIAPIAFMQGGGEAVLARIVYEGSPVRAAPAGEPAPLPANPLPERMNFSGALHVALPLEGGDASALDRVALFVAARGRTVVMALDNRDTAAHLVHVHGHHFRLLDRLDDGWKPYWLDTLVVAGRQTARIAFVADNPGRWPIEQHALDGPAAEASWFEVK
jgi:FtsP/CotA-like multicopper oxidase with cupredoxin domain